MASNIDDYISQGKARRLKEAVKEGGRAPLVLATCWVWSSRPDLRADCSGYAKAVADFLGISLSGDADAIYSAIGSSGAVWTALGTGKAAVSQAAAKADEGYFVLAATPGTLAAPSADDLQHGHVAVVLGTRLLRQLNEQGNVVQMRFDVFSFNETTQQYTNEITGKIHKPLGRDVESKGKLDLQTSHRPGAAWGQLSKRQEGKPFSPGAFGDKLSNAFSPRKVYSAEEGEDIKASEAQSRYGQIRYAYASIPGVTY